METFDRDYFERGLETGKSCYQNYRWIPELTIPMAMTIVDHLDIKPEHSVLDFGCAKGFLVKALRWLNRDAYGMDISKYAIDNCDPEVRKFCWVNGHLDAPFLMIDEKERFDFCIAKDVFEHMSLRTLKNVLRSRIAKTYFVVVPLGEDKRYRAPTNNMDITHITCMNEVQWSSFFHDVGRVIMDFKFRIDGIKDSYYEKYPKAHGFFTLC